MVRSLARSWHDAGEIFIVPASFSLLHCIEFHHNTTFAFVRHRSTATPSCQIVLSIFEMSEEQRPAKRVKFSGSDPDPQVVTQTRSDKAKKRAWKAGSKPNTNSVSNGKARSQQVRTFSQPSVIASGDKGIFVSCDKGQEKKALLELHDLVQQHLDECGLGTDGNPKSSVDASAESAGEEESASIEASIAAELAELRDDTDKADPTPASKPIQLITLDIPCVSFLRFPAGSTLDASDIVHQLCLKASDSANPQQGRYVKRLTPINYLAKVLSEGLEKASNECLPNAFGPDQEGRVTSLKFAIRPTLRNNDKVDRNTVIPAIASQIQELGKNEHKVDLKNPDRAVLVEVYRSWIGMSVVDNTNGLRYEKGYEQLKRFNIAEIYSSRSKQDVSEAKVGE